MHQRLLHVTMAKNTSAGPKRNNFVFFFLPYSFLRSFNWASQHILSHSNTTYSLWWHFTLPLLDQARWSSYLCSKRGIPLTPEAPSSFVPDAQRHIYTTFTPTERALRRPACGLLTGVCTPSFIFEHSYRYISLLSPCSSTQSVTRRRIKRAKKRGPPTSEHVDWLDTSSPSLRCPRLSRAA